MHRLSAYWRYSAAIAAVLMTMIVRLVLNDLLGSYSPFILFTVPVLLSAPLGVGPVLCATLLSAFCGAYFEKPGLAGLPLLIELVTFLVVAAGIAILATVLQRARRKSRQSDLQAQASRREAGVLVDELNLLIDGASGYAIYMLDPQGNVAIWNEGAERLKGWMESEVIGKNTALFYPREAAERGKPMDDLARARELGRISEEDWRCRKDGSEFLAHVTLTALYDDGGNLRGYGKVVRDISMERAAERRQVQSEAHVRSILSTVPDAMIVIDDRGSILSFSRAAENLFGYAEAEVLGSNVAMLMPPPDRTRHDDYLKRYLESGKPRIIGTPGRVVNGIKRDGTIFPMELSVGEALGDQRIFTGFIRDLTERQKAEEKMEELRQGLLHAARVSAMGTMASTLAHELNQPITAVNNYVEGVRDMLDDADPVIRDALTDASKEAMRAGDIVRRLREFVGRGEVGRTIEDLPRLVAEAVTLGAIGAREKGVEISIRLAPETTPVLVDKVQTQQVLINLIRNAMEAMHDSPVRRVTISSQAHDHNFVRVTVADTGPGISAQAAESLFRAFVSTKEDGMGLGLSICRTIIEASGGRIWFETGPEGGSMFHFTLAMATLEGSDER